MSPLFFLALILALVLSSTAFQIVPSRVTFKSTKKAFTTAIHLTSSSSSSSTVLERPAVLSKPSTVLNPSPSSSNKLTKPKGWSLRIFNDTTNTREHVARTLVQVTSKSEAEAYNLMMSAHRNGLAVVGIFLLEQAEMFCEQLGEFGLVADIQPIDE
ncbi:hypothetical protein TrVE_jg9638 [Triparma verrucosa]|uniref:Adaptor protein ClpS core domain-containing protein n=1 Tax=Triparma verrucosa TaxID=1606542 RepID=A0A9W7FJQ6_9STRA|nr:hypothetical protein TrVE_jg9638 [Triparma verrucosa]